MPKESTLSALAMASFAAFVVGCTDHHDEELAKESESETDTAEEQVDPLTADDDLDGISEDDGDCNDHNDAVYPGARERSFDGVDSNCDGQDLPAGGTDHYAEALALLDGDGDGAISFEEFEAGCRSSAMVIGTANPGVVQTHSDCSGTNGCRGMILHPWNELYEHDCRGVNGCAGWSCVEAAAGEGRDGEVAFREAHCTSCHSGADGAFFVQVPEGEDVAAWVDSFWERSDQAFLSAIAFGIKGRSAEGVAYTNMPGHYEQLSRAEMEAVIAYVRTLPLEAPTE